jgi:ABC-2 type transporter
MNEVSKLEESNFFPKDTRTWTEARDLKSARSTVQASFSVQLSMLLLREKTGFEKNPAVVIINLGITAFLAIVFGVIFSQVGTKGRTEFTVVQSQLGAVVNILISTMFGQSQVALTTFPTERPMFIREYATHHYSVVTYFLSRLAMEAFQTILATTVQALLAYFMIGFKQSFWQFLAVTFSLAMTSTAVAVLLSSFFTDSTASESMFTVRICVTAHQR